MHTQLYGVRPHLSVQDIVRPHLSGQYTVRLHLSVQDIQ